MAELPATVPRRACAEYPNSRKWQGLVGTARVTRDLPAPQTRSHRLVVRTSYSLVLQTSLFELLQTEDNPEGLGVFRPDDAPVPDQEAGGRRTKTALATGIFQRHPPPQCLPERVKTGEPTFSSQLPLDAAYPKPESRLPQMRLLKDRG